jgi:hypothetical protein
VRWLGVLVAVLITSSAEAGQASDPAFLGVGMDPGAQTGGCPITSIVPGGAAEAAGLRIGDVVLAIDGNPTPMCASLSAGIVAHALGDTVRIDLHRGFGRIAVKATLTSRSDVLHRQFVGRSLDGTDAVYEDGATIDLGDLRGRPAVIGWFDLHHCAGCAAVFDRLDTRLRGERGDAAPRMIAVTESNGDDLRVQRKTFSASVPLALAAQTPLTRLLIEDPLRVQLMVLDGRGTIRFVTPISPDDDDLDAVLDEVLAAAEQAEHARRR